MPSGAITTIYPSPQMPSNEPWSRCWVKKGMTNRSPLTNLEDGCFAARLSNYGGLVRHSQAHISHSTVPTHSTTPHYRTALLAPRFAAFLPNTLPHALPVTQE